MLPADFLKLLALTHLLTFCLVSTLCRLPAWCYLPTAPASCTLSRPSGCGVRGAWPGGRREGDHGQPVRFHQIQVGSDHAIYVFVNSKTANEYTFAGAVNSRTANEYTFAAANTHAPPCQAPPFPGHFLSGLGTPVDIMATDPKTLFIGGLGARDDGQFAYIWQDDAMQVAEWCFVTECVFCAIQPHSFSPPVLQSSSPPPCAPGYLPHCHPHAQ